MNPSKPLTRQIATALLMALSFPVVAQEPAKPIDLEAASSSYDRQNGHLVFTEIRITQGDLGISADTAEATELKFDNSAWKFSGNVILRIEGTIVKADLAIMDFFEHRLQRAKVTGDPATIESDALKRDDNVRGHAMEMDYDKEKGILSMTGDAWIGEGQSEISGSQLLYDFNAKHVIAGAPADETRGVRILISPPDKKADDQSSDQPADVEQDQ